MPQWYIWFWAVYGCLTVVLIVLKLFKIGSKKRGVTKMLTSLSFVAAGIYGMAVERGELSALLLAGLCFASLGDLLLVFRHIADCFVYGVVSFLVASILFSVYSIVIYGFSPWAILPYVLFLAFNFLAQKYKLYSYGRHKVCLNAYSCTVSFCGCLGLTLFAEGVKALPMFLFGLGCFIYFISDVLLGLYLYKFRNRFVDAINSMLYFPGLLMIAVSLWF